MDDKFEDTTVCIRCGEENAYFDGTFYVCPDCDCEWKPCQKTIIPKNPPLFEDEYIYDQLVKLERPFFKLKHGQMYNCKIHTKDSTEEMSIIPLAFEKNKNRQFILVDAINQLNKNPQIVKEIIEKDFDYIWEYEQDKYRKEYNALIYECATNEGNTLIDEEDAVFYDFHETKKEM